MPEPASQPPAHDGAAEERLRALVQQPGSLFRRLASQSHALFHRLSAQDEITAPQLTLLATLVRSGPLPQAELGRIVGIDKNTLTEMLRRMEARGLLSRSRHPTDRRALTIAITAAGGAWVEQLAPAAMAVGAAMLAPLAPEHHALFMECLQLLAENLDSAERKTLGAGETTL